MSLSELASAEIARGARRGASLLEQQLLNAAGKISGAMLPTAYMQNAPVQPDQQQQQQQQNQPVQQETGGAIQALVKYIPAESTTLYIAASSASVAISSTFAFFTPTFSYWFFAAMTPVLFMLILAGKRRANNMSPFPSLRDFPYWNLSASFIAFLAWGLAVPGNPYATTPMRGATFAFIAIFASTILSMLEPIFQPSSAPAQSAP